MPELLPSGICQMCGFVLMEQSNCPQCGWSIAADAVKRIAAAAAREPQAACPSPLYDLLPEETQLSAFWFLRAGKLEPAPSGERFAWLIQTRLERLMVLGTESLYRDARDNRLWELTWPRHDALGGGYTRLSAVSLEHARAKYGL